MPIIRASRAPLIASFRGTVRSLSGLGVRRANFILGLTVTRLNPPWCDRSPSVSENRGWLSVGRLGNDEGERDLDTDADRLIGDIFNKIKKCMLTDE